MLDNQQCIFSGNLDFKHKGIVGGKAWNLATLAKNGFKTAVFFVVPNILQHRVLSRGMSLDIQKEIINKIMLMKSAKFAIRSSANYEDGDKSSFAGQFDSFLAIPRSRIIESIHACYQAVNSEQVKLYCDFHGFDPRAIKMAVIVQEMVAADKGGVVFTRDFESNKNDRLVIEAANGLGEQVVSGIVNPQKIIVNKNTQEIIKVINNGQMVLNSNELRQLVEISLKIEKLFGQPQDIEWAIAKGQIYILQTRPITT